MGNAMTFLATELTIKSACAPLAEVDGGSVVKIYGMRFCRTTRKEEDIRQARSCMCGAEEMRSGTGESNG